MVRLLTMTELQGSSNIEDFGEEEIEASKHWMKENFFASVGHVSDVLFSAMVLLCEYPSPSRISSSSSISLITSTPGQEWKSATFRQPSGQVLVCTSSWESNLVSTRYQIFVC